MARSSSFVAVDPYYEPSYTASRTQRGKSDIRGLGVPKTDYKTYRENNRSPSNSNSFNNSFSNNNGFNFRGKSNQN
jgi:hypothetical protein